MTKKEKTIAKYVALLNDLKKKCMAGEEISVRAFCEAHKAGHMSVKAAQHFGYVKKIGVRKFKWMVSGDVTPIMAKCITDWNFEYTMKSINKKRNDVALVVDHINGKVYEPKPKTPPANDCEIVKLKYQAMLDHQKIVDLETSIKNGELALKNAKMDVDLADKLSKANTSNLEWELDKKDKTIASLRDKVTSLVDQSNKKHSQIDTLVDMINQVPTVTYYLFGIPVWKRKEKVSR